MSWVKECPYFRGVLTEGFHCSPKAYLLSECKKRLMKDLFAYYYISCLPSFCVPFNTSTISPVQREEAALRAMEEQRMKEEKRRRQEETMADLDYSLKLKMKRKAKNVQQELALDMKLLEQMLTATTNEAMQSLQRKVYRHSLCQCKQSDVWSALAISSWGGGTCINVSYTLRRFDVI